MSQNLPIQGPQVMEIQGGVRLTPLGLQQLGAEANRFLIPVTGVVVQPDPGTGGTTVIDPLSTAPLQPTQVVISIPNQNYTGDGTYNLTLADYGLVITGISYVALATGHGSANDVQLFNGVAGTKFATVNTIDAVIKTQLPTDKILFNTYASAVIQKGGTISAVVRGGGNNKTLGVLTLHGFATA
jgi:hypothetical protein